MTATEVFRNDDAISMVTFRFDDRGLWALRASPGGDGEIGLQFVGSGMVPRFVPAAALRTWLVQVLALCEQETAS